ncbi:fungal-specific transcription factor domain-containing protein [Calycina marina]|uniref:Fungal-specific transcription factor domain-containing protein n=1 Tax=Calycina marina TaxID=1763456 RepID=A0A9P7Z701_9HELO|nr:fungal-specific transcription factor domain-containing protein [Calycina marina]
MDSNMNLLQQQLPLIDAQMGGGGGGGGGSGCGNAPNNSDLSQLRKRVSQACQPCARRKTKCDGMQPVCSQCRQRDVPDCSYAQSRRNKRTRRSTPSGYDSPYASVDRAHEYRYQQDGPARPNDQGMPSNTGFAALDALAASATARRSDPLQLSLRQQQLPQPGLIIDRPTSIRLFKMYFSTIHPMWPILYKPMYDLTGLEYLPDHMPQALLYAIYSIAACVQPLYDGSEEPFGDTPNPQLVFEAALGVLQQHGPLNFLKPSYDNCQALAILSLQQHGVSEDTSAALLCSLASSMALELRIHRALPPGADATDVQIRSRLWWNIFVLDKMMACEMGRPVHLRWEECDNPPPSMTESDEFQLLSLRVAGQNRVSSVKTHTISGFHTTIEITKIMEQISREIYSAMGRKAISVHDASVEATRLRLAKLLTEYGEMMDASPLRLDMNSGSVAAPVTITNMVWMWCLTILLHRPFITHQNSEDITALDPLQECVIAATNIYNILEGYSDNLPMLSCDLIFPIFTTASTLRYCHGGDNGVAPEVGRQITLCIDWLRTLGRSWKNATSRQEMLAADFKPSPGLISGAQTPEPGAQDSRAQLVPENWAFLNGFGDPSDEFGSMDASFRHMLQLEGQSMNV